MPILFALFLVFATVAQAESMEGSEPKAAAEVKGDVLYWEGEEIIVKEMSGNQRRLHVTKETKMVGVISTLKPGDKISAQVDSDGHARVITLVIPDGNPASVIPPGSR
jgi:hypothetical protein